MNRTGIIIQARLDSTRLCHKVLREIHGKTVLRWVVDACNAAQTPMTWPILTTPDVALIEHVAGWRVNACLWEHVRDPLGEYIRAARKYRLDIIVRITADCPMLRGEIIDKAIYAYLHRRGHPFSGKWPVYYNGLDGADVEVFSRSTLEESNHRFENIDDREHVLFKLHRHVGRPGIKARNHYKSLDTLADLVYIRSVLKP